MGAQYMIDGNLDDGDEFQDFARCVGKFMARGLNRLNPEQQEAVQQAIEGGAEILALTRCAPLCVEAILRKADGSMVQLFKVTPGTEAAPTWN